MIGVKDMVLNICYYAIITGSILINGQQLKNKYDKLNGSLATLCVTLARSKINNFYHDKYISYFMLLSNHYYHYQFYDTNTLTVLYKFYGLDIGYMVKSNLITNVKIKC